MYTDAPSKDEFLANIRQERARLDAAVARVGARMEEPALEGGRSVKDVLAHISAWEKIAMALVRNNEPLIQQPPGEGGQASTDVINDKVYQDNRNRPLADVVADTQRSYADLMEMVESMSQEQLETPLGGQQFAGKSPSAAAIFGGNSDGHYHEHTEQIERWLDSDPR